MPPYRQISAFYDAVMDDPGPRADRVNAWIDRFRPGAASLLELGCGTGSILERILGIDSLTGLDRSPEMLAMARSKVPAARFVEGDMADFSLGETFDVVVSVFDSINHLLTFEAWRSMFDAVHDHLAEGGLFIFDVNTVGELRRLGDDPPWVYEFAGGVMIMDVAFAEDALSSCLFALGCEDLRAPRRRGVPTAPRGDRRARGQPLEDPRCARSPVRAPQGERRAR